VLGLEQAIEEVVSLEKRIRSLSGRGDEDCDREERRGYQKNQITRKRRRKRLIELEIISK